MYKKCENCYKDGKVPDAESCKKCEDDLKAKAQELQQATDELQRAMDNYVQLDLQRVKEYNELVDLYKAKEQECEELKEKLKYLQNK